MDTAKIVAAVLKPGRDQELPPYSPLPNLTELCSFAKKGFMQTVLNHTRPMEVEQGDTDTITLHDDPYSLVVWNDEVNTFEWVIETLVEVCGHSADQAEQCAMIIHAQGKYAVKNGTYDALKPMCDAITDRKIGATIEITSSR